MADFVQVMKDWRRICDTIQSKNQQIPSGGWCNGCPLQWCCIIDSEIKDTTDNELAMIGERIQSWAKENPEPVYPSWGKWLQRMYNSMNYVGIFNTPIPADIAEKLGLEAKTEAD